MVETRFEDAQNIIIISCCAPDKHGTPSLRKPREVLPKGARKRCERKISVWSILL